MSNEQAENHGHSHATESVEPDVGGTISYALLAAVLGLFATMVVSLLFVWALTKAEAKKEFQERNWSVMDPRIQEQVKAEKQTLSGYDKGADGRFQIPVDKAMEKLAKDPALLAPVGVVPAPVAPDGAAPVPAPDPKGGK